MRVPSKLYWLACPFMLSGTTLQAAVIAIGPAAFPAGSTLLTFTGLADGTEVNGLTVSGVQFSYTVGGSPLNGAVVIDGGPGPTNNISPPNIVSVGNNTGTLTLFLPSPATTFGYGYAILNAITVPNATTISVSRGATPLGSLSYTGVPDPSFTGGFAGIASTDAFDRVSLTFNATASSAFAIDNIRIAAVPEPSTTVLIVIGGLTFVARRRVRRRYLARATGASTLAASPSSGVV